MSKPVIVSEHDVQYGSLKGYITGFVFSVYLTLSAFAVVYWELFSYLTAAYVIAGLAVVQFIVQLVYFLHIGRESKPRWKAVVFYFMLMVVVIVVFGSLWIMQNLNYSHGHQKSTKEQYEYLHSQDGL